MAIALIDCTSVEMEMLYKGNVPENAAMCPVLSARGSHYEHVITTRVFIGLQERSRVFCIQNIKRVILVFMLSLFDRKITHLFFNLLAGPV